MGTVPTGHMERELRKLYLQWLAGVSRQDDFNAYVDKFAVDSSKLIAKLGGQTASLGALGDFPTPKLLELSPRAGVIYDDMKQAAIKAGIAAGLQSTDVARQMLNAGLDVNFRKLNRLARTETVSAYWMNSWASVADLPAIVMVWGAERGPRTCDYCLSRDGLVVEDMNIRDHPQGRCTLIPTLRSHVKYKGTLQPDGSVTMDPAWSNQKVAGAKAKDSAGPTTAEQRDPLSTKQNPAAPSQASQTSQSRPVDNSTTVKVDIGKATPQPVDVKTFGAQVDTKTRKARLQSGDWRYIDDRDKRAVTLLQNEFQSEQYIKKLAANLREGGDGSGVAFPKTWSKNFTGHVTDAGVRYTEQDVRDALLDAARWLNEQDLVKPKVMYKGLDVPAGKIKTLFQEGATFDTNFSSFTTDEVIARRYSSRRASQQVIVRVKSAPAVRIQGNPTADHWKTTKEHLVTGRGRVVKVTEAHNGRTVYVDVEF